MIPLNPADYEPIKPPKKGRHDGSTSTGG